MDQRPLVEGRIPKFGIFLDVFEFGMIFFRFSKKLGLGVFLVDPTMVIGATIRIGREMLCLPLCGILSSLSPNSQTDLCLVRKKIVTMRIRVNYLSTNSNSNFISRFRRLQFYEYHYTIRGGYSTKTAIPPRHIIFQSLFKMWGNFYSEWRAPR